MDRNNDWYFGTTSHPEMTSSLIATSSSDGLMDSNLCSPLRVSTTCASRATKNRSTTVTTVPTSTAQPPTSCSSTRLNSKTPEHALFPHDRPDAAEPWSMFWYDVAVSGAYWNGLGAGPLLRRCLSFHADELDRH
ncbi:hypothetical protein M407DRAFT_34793 [Tulasnella calospora MUT 4182]|uniref:Uncharacterized protein n=1 Tax=Tulasnella calospora MUT 4182 TaxID=1051891 RepID=A0A0C3K2G6_9AGAM|nr:hypothetical protein M407DRAFT_34793 [Tulasnella calospora MUT 4182]